MTDNLPQILGIVSNVIVLTKQMHLLAREQFENEHKEGSRSSSRGLMLAEIGTALQGMEKELESIVKNLNMLEELPWEIDPSAAEVIQIF